MASTTHQTSETQAQAEIDGPVGPNKLRDRGSGDLGDDETSSVEVKVNKTIPSSKLGENDPTRPAGPGNASEDMDSLATSTQIHRAVRGLMKREQDATMSRGVVYAVQGATSTTSSSATDAQACPALSTSQTPWDDAKAGLENPYCYSPLLRPDSIRLLGLIPHEDDNGPMQCRLYDYPLQKSGKGTHLYEALSYVWGGLNNLRCISIEGCNLHITENLYAALIHLRDRHIERIIWVDAICIDQNNKDEQAQQIQYMAEIYGKASRVIVWLGEEKDDSDRALEEIRIAADKMPIKSLISEPTKQAILKLLHRPWFQRIWVLQEVAAARHILIKCGSTEIDGHAFSVALDSTWCDDLYETSPELQSWIRPVTYLIGGAVFRPQKIARFSGRFSLGIRPLGELIDMYHTRMTSDALDKVFALLGMSSDTIPTALLPDYEIPWETLLERLVQFLLGEQVSVKAWAHTEMAVVEGKGSVLGKVSSVRSNIAGNGGQDVDIIFNDLNISKQSGYRGGKTARWTLQFSAKPIQAGDLICLLQGASKPTIMRSCKDYFAIVMIAATPLEDTQAATRDLERPTLLQSVKAFTRDFLLVWDWKNSPTTSQDLERYTTSMGQDNWVSDLDDSTRLWNVALILEDAKEHEIARQKFQEATKGYEKAVGEYYPYTLKSEYIQTPLSWAAGNGCGIVVELLLKKDGIDPDLKESQSGLTPLSRAAGEGHEAVAKLLLATGKVDIHSKENSDRTALSRAAEKGHEAVVKLLLATGEVDVDSKGTVYGQTPLSWAAEKGHEAVVKLLLATGKVNIDSKDNHGRTPLWWAASGGHEAVVKLLLATGKVDVDSKDNDGLTPLWWAARHEAVVKLLRSHIPHAAQ